MDLPVFFRSDFFCSRNSALVQARAALAFAYEHWDVPNPLTRLKPPRSTPPPPVSFLQAHDLARLLGHLGDRRGQPQALRARPER